MSYILYKLPETSDVLIKVSAFIVKIIDHTNYSMLETPDGWSIYSSLMMKIKKIVQVGKNNN